MLFLSVAKAALPYPFLNDYPIPGEGGGGFWGVVYSEQKGCENNVPMLF